MALSDMFLLIVMYWGFVYAFFVVLGLFIFKSMFRAFFLDDVAFTSQKGETCIELDRFFEEI